MWTRKSEQWRRRNDRALRLIIGGTAVASPSEDDDQRIERSKALHPSCLAAHPLLEHEPPAMWWDFWSW